MAGIDNNNHPKAAGADGIHAVAGAAVGTAAGGAGEAKKPARQAGRYAYGGLQRVIHERSRLGILSSLAAHPEGLLFTDLKALCNLTDGNLSRQLQLLQETGFLQVIKGFKNNRPQTLCQLTDVGRERFLEYIGVLENVVADAMAASKQPAPHPHAVAHAAARVSPA